MKFNFILLILFLFSAYGNAIAQTDYYPEKREGVTDQKYERAIYALKNTYKAVKDDNNTFTYMDHMNLTWAFIALKEPKEKVFEQLALAQERNLESTAEVFLLIAKKEKFEGYLSGVEYDSLLEKFTIIMKDKKEVKLDLKLYSEDNGYDYQLVKLIAKLAESDQEFRGLNGEDLSKQNSIDEQNILTVDSLFKKHRNYIGNSMVGKDFNYVMWVVIQHSDLEHQEYYLPIVHEAVKQNELKDSSLKLLIDRVYVRKYGYQIFGSQSNSDLAEEDVICEVKFKYGL